MITDKLLSILFNIIEGFLAKLPSISFTFDTEIFDVVLGVIEGILYFFPLSKLLPIFSLIVLLQSFRITIRILRTIISLLPW